MSSTDTNDIGSEAEMNPNQDKVMATVSVTYGDWKAVEAGCKWHTIFGRLRPDAFVIDPDSEIDEDTKTLLTGPFSIPVTHEKDDRASTLHVPSFYDELYDTDKLYWPSLTFNTMNKRLKFFKQASDDFEYRKAASAVFAATIEANAEAYQVYTDQRKARIAEDKITFERLGGKYSGEAQVSLLDVIIKFLAVSGAEMDNLMSVMFSELPLGAEPRDESQLPAFGNETDEARENAYQEMRKFADWSEFPNSHEQLENLLDAGPIPEEV